MELISKIEYLKIIEINNQYIKDIYNICLQHDCYIEGNCFYQDGNIHNSIEGLIPKQMNHFTLGKQSNNILEIGFNAGHSCLLYLLSNPNSKITIFDLCFHPYAIPCLQYLQSKFSGRINLHIGNSNYTVSEFSKNNPNTKFDLIHIDGGHDRYIANKDFFNCLKVASNFMIWDDTHIQHLNHLFDTYVDLNLIEELYLYKTYEYEHRIGRVLS